jgi:tetratricopeptide (TPR) repeat protein
VIAFALALAVQAAPSGCTAPRASEPILLVVSSADPALRKHDDAVARAIRAVAARDLTLLPREATEKALSIEGGEDRRERTLVDARVIVNRAEDRFRELDDEEALALLANAIAKLTGVHQEPGAIELLARSHLLAGAIYLARGRTEAARQRIQRALDLEPELAPPRDRFAPEVLAEVATVRGAQATRPTGRLVVTAKPAASVYVDGRLHGTTPVEIDNLGTGTHVLRVGAPGRESRIETLQIATSEDRRVEIELTPDPEITAIAELPSLLQKSADATPVLELLARRGGAERTLLARSVLANELTFSGTATIGVYLSTPGLGSAFAQNLSKSAIAAALGRMLACAHEAPDGSHPAPSILGIAGIRTTQLAPVPEPKAWWESPWFWAIAAVAAVGISAGFVVARTAGGPPQAVEVTLIPRP